MLSVPSPPCQSLHDHWAPPTRSHATGICERGDSNPYGYPLDPKSSASANSATLAHPAANRHTPNREISHRLSSWQPAAAHANWPIRRVFIMPSCSQLASTPIWVNHASPKCLGFPRSASGFSTLVLSDPQLEHEHIATENIPDRNRHAPLHKPAANNDDRVPIGNLLDRDGRGCRRSLL